MLNTLQNTKADIKDAIINQKAEITGGMVTYADSIRSISSYDITDVLPKGTKLAFSRSDSIFNAFDFSKLNDCYRIFYKSSFKNVSNFNARSTNWQYAFEENRNLLTVDGLNLSGAKFAGYMFQNCTAVTDIPVLEGGSLEMAEYMFYNCKSLTNFGGIRNLGYCSGKWGTQYPRVVVGYMFSGCTSLTRESVLNVFNNLYDLTLVRDVESETPPFDFARETISFPQVVLDKLTEEDIAIAVAKNWTVTSV